MQRKSTKYEDRRDENSYWGWFDDVEDDASENVGGMGGAAALAIRKESLISSFVDTRLFDDVAAVRGGFLFSATSALSSARNPSSLVFLTSASVERRSEMRSSRMMVRRRSVR